MAEEPIKKKAWYEIISILTPFIIGICVTGLGTYFTQVYNFRQLQINQLNLLDKFRESLVSEDANKRTFAYESFVILGYESLAGSAFNELKCLLSVTFRPLLWKGW